MQRLTPRLTFFLTFFLAFVLSLGLTLAPPCPSPFLGQAHAQPAGTEDSGADNGADDTAGETGGQAGNAAKDPFARVFNTVGIKRPLKLFPFWQGVLERDAEHPVFKDDQKMLRETWADLKAKGSQLKGLDLLRFVNSFWNRSPYIEDIDNWGRPDYWEAPYEFLQKSGDCEDYAIVKYMTLRQFGVAADDMRILVVRDTFRRLDHAVLGVNVDGTVYILDNVSDVVVSHGRLSQYELEYSVNEKSAWMHMKPRKDKKKAPKRKIVKLI